MKMQVTYKGTDATADLESRLEAVQAKVQATAPGAGFAKYVVECTPRAHAVGVILALPNGESWVRHAEGPDWERAFLEVERRLDRLAESD
ncbi:MAG: hypothetical protein PVF05_03700 [Gemmatimonadales bacterium]|jgi:hypothetical protein